MSYTDVLCMSVPTPELWISTRGLPSTDVQSTSNTKINQYTESSTKPNKQ